MRLALRYAVSIAVGLAVTIPVGEWATGDWLVTVSLLPLFAAATSLIIAHRRRWARSNGELSPRAGAAVGGAGAFTGGALIRTSPPAAAAGFGLLLLGMAAGIAVSDSS
jgi:hypothetical protein